MAIFCSNESENLLTNSGDASYKNYHEQQQKLCNDISQLIRADANFYERYMFAIKELFNSGGAATTANINQNQFTLKYALGAYIFIRHDAAAYAKQSHTSVGRSVFSVTESDKTPPMAVAKTPSVFKQLAQAVDSLATALEKTGLDLHLAAIKELLSF